MAFVSLINITKKLQHIRLKRLPVKVLVFFLFNLFFFVSTAQTTRLVTNTADSGPGSLRDAVASAVAGDIIRFSEASFTGGGVQTITITTGYIIFAQDALVFKGFYNAAGDTVKVSGNNASGLLYCTAANNLLVDSMVLTNAIGGSGAAIHTETQNLTINNSIISNSKCNYTGGGVNAYNVNVHNSIFNNNSAPTGGSGAIQAYQSVVITNSVFFNNSASNYAGAVMCSNISSITNSRFTNNSSGSGGAVWAPYNNTIVNNCTFIGNYSGSDGGAISSSANVSVTNSTFTGNTAANRGGSIFAFNLWSTSGNITANNSTFNGNKANIGGALYACVNALVTNCTFFGNIAAVGGGIDARLTDAINSTITGNTATSPTGTAGGGIEGVSIKATSSIIALNIGGDVIDGTGRSALIASGGYNIFTANPSGVVSTDQRGIDSAQLNLGSFQNNGGTTFTILPGAGSVALNRGNPNDGSNDQRGFSIPSGTTRDVGAVSVSAIEYCIWIGGVSSAWENPANWSCGHIPTAFTAVTVYSTGLHYPIINSWAVCKSIRLMTGAQCTVNTGGLNVMGK